MYEIEREELGEDCISECSAQGRCDEAVEYWRSRGKAEDWPIDEVRRHLKAMGAWDDIDTVDVSELRDRALWNICCDFHESGDACTYLTES